MVCLFFVYFLGYNYFYLDGKEVKRLSGYRPLDDFLASLKEITGQG